MDFKSYRNEINSGNCSVKELIIKENKVLGCCVSDKFNKEVNYYANYEVIICGGAIQTPALLQRSGIGDPKMLRDLGIQCLVDLPNVGKGLKDHANVRASFTVNSILTLNNYLSNYLLFSKLIIGYLIRRRNLLATPSATSHLLIKSTPEIAYPDLKLQLVHMIESQRFGVGKNTKLSKNSGFSIGVSYIFPESSGSVKIKSKDYTVPPLIQANYLSKTHDQNKTIDAINLARRIVSKSPLKDYVEQEVKPGVRKKSRTKIMYLSQMSNHKKDYDLKSSDPELNTNIENEFLMKEIHAAIDKLPENYKSVIILRDIQGLDYEQISNIIGVPLGTVKSRINRARLQLQVDLMDFKKE